MATCAWKNRTGERPFAKHLQLLLIVLVGIAMETGAQFLQVKTDCLFLYELGAMVVIMTAGLIAGLTVEVASSLLVFLYSMRFPYVLLPSLIVVLVVYFAEERGLFSSWWSSALLVVGMGLVTGIPDYLVSRTFCGHFSLNFWFFPLTTHSLFGSLVFHALDLGISVLIAIFLERHQAEPVRLRWPFQHTQPYHPLRTLHRDRRKGHSIQFSISSICVACAIGGASLLLGMTCRIYLARSISNQEAIAKHYAIAAASLVRSDDIDAIVSPDGDASAEYQQLASRFAKYLDLSTGYISSLCLYQVIPGSGGPDIRMLYDADPSTVGPRDMDDVFRQFTGTEGETGDDSSIIGPIIRRDGRNWMMTLSKPIRSSKGDQVVYLGLSFSMAGVARNVAELLLKVLTITAAVFVLMLSVIYTSIKYLVLHPVDRLIRMSRDFRASQQTHVDENDPIQSGNEFETLYASIREMEETVVNDKRRMQSYMSTIQKLAYQDELTGASNLTAYDREVERLNEEIRKGIASFSLVMLDINQLKLINDTWGHAKGDLAIKATFRAAREIFSGSLIFRIGGDEFVVLVSGDDPQSLAGKLKRLDQYHVGRGEDSPEPWNQVSLSYGVATWRKGQDHSYAEVFERADRAMYQHKASLGCRE